MGLDQYLFAECYASNAEWRGNESNELYQRVKAIADIMDYVDDDLVGDSNRSASITFKVGYWRKANHIHQWFVTRCQDGEDNCAKYYVDREKLAELKQACDEVLADKTKADDLMPCQEGFFFGATEYDEWYFKECERTSKLVEQLLKSPNDWEFYYQSSW